VRASGGGVRSAAGGPPGLMQGAVRVDNDAVTTAETERSPRRSRPVVIQILRGVGWTMAGLLSLTLAEFLLTNPGDQSPIQFDSGGWHATVDLHPQWRAILLVGAVAGVSYFLFRRVRRWPTRPRWLLPLGVVVLVAAAVPALKPFTTSSELDSRSCVPLVDAWHPVVHNPGPSDLAVWQSQYKSLSPIPSDLVDPVKRRAFVDEERRIFLAEQQQIRSTAAFQRADGYIIWTFTRGVCTPRSRQYLTFSAALLGIGAVIGVGAVSVRRRRLQTSH
jgi:hypothetical protein